MNLSSIARFSVNRQPERDATAELIKLLNFAPARNSPRITPLGRPRLPDFCKVPALPEKRLRY
jgi:hypothetical protein